MSNRRRLTDAEFAELRALANERCEEIVTVYLGPPLKRSRRELRWGDGTGSFCLVISGRKRGSWYDHDGSGGGGMLEFLRQQNGGDWSRAIDAAIHHTGYHPPSWNDNGLSDAQIRALVESARRRAEERARAQAKAQAKTQNQGAGAYAARIYKESGPATGTLGERYIQDVRFGGHDLPMPTELRFHPAIWCGETQSKHPALIVACGLNGRLARIQAILLDPVTAKKAAVKSAKLTFGANAGHVPGSFGPWNTGELQLQLLVEGPEDAIVLNAVTGWRVDASLGAGSLHKPRYPAGTRLVIVGDNGETGHTQARRAAAVHRANGCDVTVIFPPEGLKDANDVLHQGGPDAVREWISDGLTPKPPGLPSYYPAISEPREEALQRQRSIIETTIADGATIASARRMLAQMRAAELADMPDATPAQKSAVTRRQHGVVAAHFGFPDRRIPRPQRVLLTGSQGTGKTTIALESVAKIGGDIVVHKYAPTLAKCYEDQAAYREIATERSMPAYVVHGRGQDDPQHPNTRMCPRFRMVKRVVDAGLSPRQKICPSCKMRNTCGTLRQEKEIEALSR
ncbi:MAG: toprim domain-containing protein [Rhodopila sp.]